MFHSLKGEQTGETMKSIEQDSNSGHGPLVSLGDSEEDQPELKEGAEGELRPGEDSKGTKAYYSN